MAKNKFEISRDVTIVNDLGLHARSAAKISEIARDAIAHLWLQRDDERVDARSIMDILTLACEKGSTLTIVIDDPGDMGTLNRIVKLVQDGFGE
jgi:phosphocarrier protein HPr